VAMRAACSRLCVMITQVIRRSRLTPRINARCLLLHPRRVRK
jgi:hypothetical protein